jgi:DNA polymerase sigma
VESSSSAQNIRAAAFAAAAASGAGSGRSLFPVRYFDDFFASDLIALNPYTPDEENFLFRRHCSIINNDSFTSRTVQMEQELIDAIRLCDAKQYLDTITLSLELLQNTHKFFNVMRVASRGEFLKKPCKMSWNARNKSWLVEPPTWFSAMGYYSFGTFLASQFEMKLWQAYFHYANIDPRRESGHFGSGSSKASAKVTQNRHQDVLVSKSHLVDYWMQLSHPQKTALIRSMGNMIEARVKLDLSDLSYPQLLNFLLKLTSVSRNVSNADNPLLQPNNEREFIDFIFMSPLRRAGTGVDLVLRRLGVFIETAYVDQQRADLILGEKMEKEKAKSKGRKKKTNKSHPVAAPSDSHVHSPSKSSEASSSSHIASSSGGSTSSSISQAGSNSSSSNTSVANSSAGTTTNQTTGSNASSATSTNSNQSLGSHSASPSELTPKASSTSTTSTSKPVSANTSSVGNSTTASSTNSATRIESLAEAQLNGFTLVAGRRKGTFTRAKDDSAAPNQKKAPHMDHGKHRPRSKDDTHSGTWTGPPKRNLVITTSGNGTLSSTSVSGSKSSGPTSPSSQSSVTSPSSFSSATSFSSSASGSAQGATNNGNSPVKLTKRAASGDVVSGRGSGNSTNITFTTSTGLQSPSNAVLVASAHATGASQAIPLMKTLSKANATNSDRSEASSAAVLGYEAAPLSPSSSSSGATTNSTASTSTPHTTSSARRDREGRAGQTGASGGAVTNASIGAGAAMRTIPGSLPLNASLASSSAGNASQGSSALKTSSESLPAPTQMPEVAEKLALQPPLRSRPTSSPPAPQLHMLNLPSTTATSAASSTAPSPSASSTALSTTSEVLDPSSFSGAWSQGWHSAASNYAHHSGQHNMHTSPRSKRASLNSSASSASSSASCSDFSSSGYSGSTPTYSGATSTTSGGPSSATNQIWNAETMSDRGVSSRSTLLETLSDRPYPTQKTRTLPSLYRSSPAVPTTPHPSSHSHPNGPNSMSSSSHHPSPSYSSLSLASSSSSVSAASNPNGRSGSAVGTTSDRDLDSAKRASSQPHTLGIQAKDMKTSTNTREGKSDETNVNGRKLHQSRDERASREASKPSSSAVSKERPIATKSMSISAQPYYPPYSATLSPPRSEQLHHGAGLRQSTPPGRLQGMGAWQQQQNQNSHLNASGAAQLPLQYQNSSLQPMHYPQYQPYPTHASQSEHHVPLEFGPGSALNQVSHPSNSNQDVQASHSTHIPHASFSSVDYAEGTPGSSVSSPSSSDAFHRQSWNATQYAGGAGGVTGTSSSSRQQRASDDHGVVPSRHGKHRHDLAPSDRTLGNWKQQKAKRGAAAAAANHSSHYGAGSVSATMPMPSHSIHGDEAHYGQSASGAQKRGGPVSPSKAKQTNSTLLPLRLDAMHPLAYAGMGLAMGAAPANTQHPHPQAHGAASHLVPHSVSAPVGPLQMPQRLMFIVPPSLTAPEPYWVEMPQRWAPGCEKLTNEILDFVKRVDRVVAPRTNIVLETLAQVQHVVDACFEGQGLKAEMYGSFSTNLGIPSSDLDLVVKSSISKNFTNSQNSSQNQSSNSSNPSISSISSASNTNFLSPLQSPRDSVVVPLTTLYAALVREPWVKPEKMQLIDTASVPVIKLVTLNAELPVDITMEDPLKPHTGLLTRALTQQFREEFPALRPLALVLKQMLHDCGLHNIYTGGISSYFLVILIISFLQLYGGHSRNAKNSANSTTKEKEMENPSLGELLVNFLDLYGNRFNFSTTQISILGSGSHTLLPASAFHPPLPPVVDGILPPPPTIPPLNMVDPLNPNNTVGQSVFGMWQVQLAFKNAFSLLHAHFLDPSRAPNTQRRSIDSLLATVLAPQTP